MKNLSKLIREAADHNSWQQELERAALASGVEDHSQQQFVWLALCEMLDSVSVLAFDYRFNPQAFIPALKEWHAEQRTKLKVLADIAKHANAAPADLLLGKLTFRLLGQIEFAFEQHELHIQSRQALETTYLPVLDPAAAQVSQEVSVHLRKAIGRLRQLQRSDPPTSFEFEVYRSILEAAARRFEEMAHSEERSLEAA
jgi:hypothetical protein